MKKLKILLLLLFTVHIFPACSSSDKPQKVYRIVYEVHSDDWYKTQEKLWKQEIDKNQKNVDAWYSYYNAVRYASYVETIFVPYGIN